MEFLVKEVLVKVEEEGGEDQVAMVVKVVMVAMVVKVVQ